MPYLGAPSVVHTHNIRIFQPDLFKVPLNETVTAPTDNIARVLMAERAISEASIATTDDSAGQRIVPRELTETEVTTDGITRLVDFFRNIPENPQLIEGFLAAAEISRSISEGAVGTTDDNVRVYMAKRNPIEPVATFDTIARVGIFARIITEVKAVTDMLARIGMFFRNRTESVGSTGDSITTVFGFRRILVETAGSILSTTSRKLLAKRVPSDSVGASDILARMLSAFTNIVESEVVGDTLDRKLSAFRTMVESTIGTMDSSIRRLLSFRGLSQTVIVGDTLSVLASFKRIISVAAVAVMDNVIRSPIFFRPINESSLPTSDNLSIFILRKRDIVDAGIFLNNAVKGKLIAIRALSDGLPPVGDGVGGQLQKVAGIVESVIVSGETLSRKLMAFTNLVESVIVSEIVDGHRIFFITFNEASIVVGDGVAVVQKVFRIVKRLMVRTFQRRFRIDNEGDILD